MKKLLLFLVPALMLLTGCGTLIPKTVEFFQRKVKSVPELSDSAKETQRQAADFVSTKTEETKIAAIESNANTNVVALATDANTVASALSQSLGPPEDPWKKEAQRLALLLKEQQAKHNAKVEKYSDKVDKDVGKKIEGTGLVRVPYFVYIGCILLVLFLVWTGLKLYGTVNPIVGLGTNVAGRVGSAFRTRALTELTEAGEDFKTYLSKSDLAAEAKEKVLDLFRRAHAEAQSRDTQDLIETLTAK